MSTQPIARATINRQNAEHSTGPRTEDGKQRVRLNALKHGMYSASVVLPHEDAEAFERLCAHLAAAFPTQSSEGLRLRQILQDAQWRLDRITALDASLLALGTTEHIEAIDPHYDPAVRQALAQAAAYRENARVFDQLQRHESRLRRLVEQTRRDLTQLLHLLKPAAPAAAPQSAAGFVPNASSKAPEPMPHFTGPLAEIKRKQWLRKSHR